METANKYFTNCSTSLPAMEMPIKTALRFYFVCQETNTSEDVGNRYAYTLLNKKHERRQCDYQNKQTHLKETLTYHSNEI